MKALDNLKVSTKISANSGLILLLLLACSGVTIYGLMTAKDYFSDYRNLTVQTVSAAQVQTYMQTARIGVTGFVLNGNRQSAGMVAENVAQAQESIQQILNRIEDPAITARMEGAASQIRSYGQTFQTLLPMQERREQLTQKMLELAESASAALNGMMTGLQQEFNADGVFMASQAMRQLMLAQNQANLFLSENGSKQVDAVAEHLGKLKESMVGLDVMVSSTEGRQHFDALSAAIPQYEAAFSEVVGVTLRRNATIAHRLDRMGPQIASDLDQIKDDNAAQMRTIGAAALAAIDNSFIVGAGVSAFALLVGIALSLLIGRGIARPIVGMTQAMTALAAGDKESEIPAQNRKDEVGQMAGAVQVFKENMIRADEMAAQQAAEQQARERRAKAIEQMTQDFDAAVAGVLAQVGAATAELQSTASSMSATAEQTNHQAGAVAAASEQAAANVQTVAAASEELYSSIQEIGRQVSQSSTIADKASKDARKTNEQVEALAHAAQKIGEVVRLIQDIAEQTNLLALNATIEAARAGEAGKGFAVVASEVKSLATQTARATEEIGQQIGSIQTETSSAVSAIREIGQTIAEINDIAANIAAAVEEQGAATQEISRNVQEAAKGTQEVSTNIVGVTQAAAETGQAADQVTHSAGNVASQSEELRLAVENFLKGVRAA
ncbi:MULTISPECIES: methyl-accepting chemotaxis protein [Oceanibaculum]|uniref:Methyl-accepting chemotaxis sensory transducer n=2 Tax=Oceanibaculum indicum TaxID=526216 RepID=K2J8Q2_9PROT|nr:MULTISPECIES: HAMP domain-containing methyl-accepting chemotaxis protein [Oceanibaculum]EKE71608.1 methyl-accepting chemotaxis sensory transducer [Oceanibaculum indicum P24]MCH2396123.1 methyl-accepting chemotaxis protein [Oceanibaculum sp.]RKQ73762.1 methyl-accepting chemotaxis protein [Oceanibaculum indicum]